MNPVHPRIPLHLPSPPVPPDGVSSHQTEPTHLSGHPTPCTASCTEPQKWLPLQDCPCSLLSCQLYTEAGKHCNTNFQYESIIGVQEWESVYRQQQTSSALASLLALPKMACICLWTLQYLLTYCSHCLVLCPGTLLEGG